MLPKLCPPNGYLLFPMNASAANHAPSEADTGMIHKRCNALIILSDTAAPGHLQG